MVVFPPSVCTLADEPETAKGKINQQDYMLKNFIRKTILKNFFKIELSGIERDITLESIEKKYVPSIRKSLLNGLMITPAILFLDVNVLVSVVIPITMVSGTAWYAVSLANMKKKFETFGLELTTAMFNSFVSSLLVLGLLALFSLLKPVVAPLNAWGGQFVAVQISAGVLGIIATGRIIWDMFSGSLKYDINDAMLTGQNEAAEKFFKKSLSLLHSSADNLREGKGLAVANYHIGLSFYEIFSFIKATGILNGKLQALMDDALLLKRNPEMDQTAADEISIRLIDSFMAYCVNVEGDKAKKSFENISDEVNSVKTKKESQAIVDTRLSVIFEEIADLLDLQGEGLFKKPT